MSRSIRRVDRRLQLHVPVQRQPRLLLRHPGDATEQEYGSAARVTVCLGQAAGGRASGAFRGALAVDALVEQRWAVDIRAIDGVSRWLKRALG